MNEPQELLHSRGALSTEFKLQKSMSISLVFSLCFGKNTASHSPAVGFVVFVFALSEDWYVFIVQPHVSTQALLLGECGTPVVLVFRFVALDSTRDSPRLGEDLDPQAAPDFVRGWLFFCYHRRPCSRFRVNED